ncbi:hypothetical protein PYW07_015582 [Mythimna separata]|uniref:Uncharacterized protein n=1 Tax=Mythimna separata TaxID=271217 RepID=A0AAD7YZ27_MYTSE|nr:hypothetical protein PYW07_015582 [Mythimna separata]
MLRRGMLPNAKRDMLFPGFPTMRHLKYQTSIKKGKVKVFDQQSRNDNMIVEIIRETEKEDPLEKAAVDLLGKVIWVGWPHLTRAKVISVSDEKMRLHYVDKQNNNVNGGPTYTTEANFGNLHKQWISERSTIIEHNMNRLGIELGDVKIIIHAVNLKGFKYMIQDNVKMVQEPEWCSVPCGYASQAVVRDVRAHIIQEGGKFSTPQEAYPPGDTVFLLTQGQHYGAHATGNTDNFRKLIKSRETQVQEAYPPGDTVFLLTQGQHYGAHATVVDSESIRSGRIKVLVREQSEPLPTSYSSTSTYRAANHAAAACGTYRSAAGASRCSCASRVSRSRRATPAPPPTAPPTTPPPPVVRIDPQRAHQGARARADGRIKVLVREQSEPLPTSYSSTSTYRAANHAAAACGTYRSAAGASRCSCASRVSRSRRATPAPPPTAPPTTPPPPVVRIDPQRAHQGARARADGRIKVLVREQSEPLPTSYSSTSTYRAANHAAAACGTYRSAAGASRCSCASRVSRSRRATPAPPPTAPPTTPPPPVVRIDPQRAHQGARARADGRIKVLVREQSEPLPTSYSSTSTYRAANHAAAACGTYRSAAGASRCSCASRVSRSRRATPAPPPTAPPTTPPPPVVRIDPQRAHQGARARADGRIKVLVREQSEPLPTSYSSTSTYRAANHAAAACGTYRSAAGASRCSCASRVSRSRRATPAPPPTAPPTTPPPPVVRIDPQRAHQGARARADGRIKVLVREQSEPLPTSYSSTSTYRAANHAAAACGVSAQMLSRITGTVLVVAGPRHDLSTDNLNKVNLGLNLKFNKKNLEVAGYTRRCKVTNSWLYSERCIELVKAYELQYPELFDSMSAFNKDIYFESDLFPNDIGKGKPLEIAQWLKNQPHSRAARRECGSEALEPEEMKLLAQDLDRQLIELQSKEKKVTLQVKWNLLYKAELHSGNVSPDARADFKLYDRVVCVARHMTVPAGARGTIVADIAPPNNNTVRLSDKLNADHSYLVMFDKPFPGAMTEDLFDEPRFYRLSPSNMLNLSFGRKLRGAVSAAPAADCFLPQTHNLLRRGDGHHSAFANYSPPGDKAVSPDNREHNSHAVANNDSAPQDNATHLLRSLLKISENDADAKKKKPTTPEQNRNWRVKNDNHPAPAPANQQQRGPPQQQNWRKESVPNSNNRPPPAYNNEWNNTYKNQPPLPPYPTFGQPFQGPGPSQIPFPQFQNPHFQQRNQPFTFRSQDNSQRNQVHQPNRGFEQPGFPKHLPSVGANVTLGPSWNQPNNQNMKQQPNSNKQPAAPQQNNADKVNNPFVPLQVQTSQRRVSQPSGSSNRRDSRQTQPKSTLPKPQPTNQPMLQQQQDQTSRPMKKKKPRIAANLPFQID